MTKSAQKNNVNRREFIKQSGAMAAGAAVLASISPMAFACDDETIRLALIGCGGRGTGAVGDALSVPNEGPVQLYAMADIHGERIEPRLAALKKRFPDKVNVSADRKFIGFQAYKQAVDILRPGDVALCTTRAYIRPVHVEYAISKGINVFFEKPFASDHRQRTATVRGNTSGTTSYTASGPTESTTNSSARSTQT